MAQQARRDGAAVDHRMQGQTHHKWRGSGEAGTDEMLQQMSKTRRTFWKASAAAAQNNKGAEAAASKKTSKLYISKGTARCESKLSRWPFRSQNSSYL